MFATSVLNDITDIIMRCDSFSLTKFKPKSQADVQRRNLISASRKTNMALPGRIRTPGRAFETRTLMHEKRLQPQVMQGLI
jgi:hypothetical protein